MGGNNSGRWSRTYVVRMNSIIDVLSLTCSVAKRSIAVSNWSLIRMAICFFGGMFLYRYTTSENSVFSCLGVDNGIR